MKVFISWSKSLSKNCAELLRDWIKCTLQASQPWVSSKDIDKGSLWFNEINDQLKDTKVGIVCLTKENKDNPWILFESGALAKGLSANRVCTFLIDLTPADLENPLAQFNHTLPTQDGLKSLLITINKELGVAALEDRIIDQVFQIYWPQFENNFKKILSHIPPDTQSEPERSSDEILTEILYTTRTLDKRIRLLEQTNRKYNNVINTKNLDNDEVEDVIRYRIKPPPDIDTHEILSILSNTIDPNRINIKNSGEELYIVVPDLGDDKNFKIKELINAIENRALEKRFTRPRQTTPGR